MKSIGILKTIYNQIDFVDKISKNINDYASPYISTFIHDDCSTDGKCTKGETCTKEVKE